MLSKKNRADKKAVEQIFKLGKTLGLPNLTFRFLLEGNSISPRISFIAPKSVAKLAVKRNFLRRRGYDILKKYIHQFPLGLTGVFIFKKFISSTLEIENEIKNILIKIN